MRRDAPLTASDGVGNTYTLDAVAVNRSRTQTAIFSGYVSAPLSAGDQITVTHPRGRAVLVSVDVFSGVAASGRIVDTGAATGRSATPSVTVTVTGEDTLVIGSVSTRRNRTSFTQPSGWNDLGAGQTRCGRRMVSGGAWVESSGAGAVSYAPTLGNRAQWAAAAVAYGSG